MEADDDAMQPRMGVPSSRAVLADMRMWTPVPWGSKKPVRVVAAGPDISVGWQILSRCCWWEPPSLMSSMPPEIITLAFPDNRASQAISTDCKAVALQNPINPCKITSDPPTHQAPTEIFIGPLEDKRSKLAYPAAVLMKPFRLGKHHALR